MSRREGQALILEGRAIAGLKNDAPGGRGAAPLLDIDIGHGRQAGSVPLLALDTADCVGDYKALRDRGVMFHGVPETGPWGTGVLLEDLHGNKVFLNQEA